MSMNVGFIGLGLMGAPMALNLARGGHPLWVHDRRAEAAAPLAAAGARVCTSSEEAARTADVTFIMVPDTAAVEEAILGPDGVLAGVKPGASVAVMSTISPEAARTLAARLGAHGIEMLDAPVSGGEAEAAGGTLTIMAGGKPEVFERVKPLFERLGTNIVHVGPSGTGELAKSCNQILVTLAIEGVAEAFTFARKNGVDPYRVREALLGGFAGSKALEVQGKRMLDRGFRPGFKVSLHQEDLRVIMETAHAAGVALPGLALAAQQMNALIGMGDGELDSSALVKVIERLNEDASRGGEK
ncbi:MAG: NAD(P)-dependent oxidoreductase [Syntrophales bacterium]